MSISDNQLVAELESKRASVHDDLARIRQKAREVRSEFSVSNLLSRKLLLSCGMAGLAGFMIGCNDQESKEILLLAGRFLLDRASASAVSEL